MARVTCFVGVDPGSTTGLCRWDSNTPPSEIAWLQPPRLSVGPALRSFIRPGDLVACERFVIGRRTLRATRAGTEDATAVIGIVQDTCGELGAKLSLQTASDAKNLGRDPLLRHIGWHWRGYRHATDAARHMLTLIARTDVALFERIIDFAESTSG